MSDNLENTLKSVYLNQKNIWVVEWYVTVDGLRKFNISDLEEHIFHSYQCMREDKTPKYHLLGFADTRERASMIIKEFESIDIPDNLVPLPFD